MRLTDFKALTFDCYGTLIDWESGIWNALQPLLSASGLELGRDQALETFAKPESAQEAATPGLIYPALLATVHRQLSEHWGLETTPAMDADFGASVPDWRAFPDSTQALTALKRHFKLVILSNVDRNGFAASNRRLAVAFDAVYTAQDIGSYKPTPANFTYLLEHLKADLGLDKSDILHTAQSLFHDHAPAQDFGLATCWIDRRKGQDGWGATLPPPAVIETDFHFAGMADLAAAVRAEAGD
jgi:2-haloalkanoic acid dehalogenase type II